MKSRASLIGPAFAAALVASPVAAQSPGAVYAIPGEAPPRALPQGSSAEGREQRFDEVGYAVIGDETGASARVAGLMGGAFAEVTAIDSGRTIVVAVTEPGTASGPLATLSAVAAEKLGFADEPFAVRIRRVVPTPPDVTTIRAGVPADRADAPTVLLTALRRKLGIVPSKARTAPAVAVRPAPKPVAARVTPGYLVQVVALADATRAASLARQLGGTAAPAGRVMRVQLGPFATEVAASRKRAEVARIGYPGAIVVRITP